MQCDLDTGERKTETNIFFEEDKEILNTLIECDENNKELLKASSCHQAPNIDEMTQIVGIPAGRMKSRKKLFRAI